MVVTLDTNVLYQALRGRRGASFAILQLIRQREIDMALSVTLLAEYEDVLKRPTSLKDFQLIPEDVDQFLAYLLSVSQLFEIYFRLRPNLRDESDNMVVELAVTSRSKYLVTNNVKNFSVDAELRFDDLKIVTPEQFMHIWREK